MAVLLGIVMGSTVSIASALLLTWIVFLLLPEYKARLAAESVTLLRSFAVVATLAIFAIVSFRVELRLNPRRWLAHLALVAMILVAVWFFWPQRYGG
ncbi:MAG: hypothetical protein R3E77_08180 [Steroidobacteraceae bacterium]